MNNFSEYTPTELLKLINDAKQSHDNLKQEIINDTYEYDRLEELGKKINEKLEKLAEIEKNYVDLIEEISKR